MRLQATFRKASKNQINSLKAVSELANPELYIPLRLFHSTYTQDQIAIYHSKLIVAIASHLDFAYHEAEFYIQEYQNDLELEPNKGEQIFEKYRSHHINKINERQNFNYLYNDFFKPKGEFTIDLFKAIANEIWHITYKHNRKLIDTLSILQKVYSNYWTVQELNLRKDYNTPLYYNSLSTLYSFNKMEPVLDKEYLLPMNFIAHRYGKLEDVQNTIHGPSYKIDIDSLECTVYTDRLNSFLKRTSIKVSDLKADYAEVLIDGTCYKQSYKNGFQEGIDAFNKKYNLEKHGNFLGIDKYIETLYALKFNECKDALWSPGLEGIRHSHIGVFNHEVIRKHGYYAGMYSQIENLMNDYEPIKRALSIYPPSYLDNPATITQQDNSPESSPLTNPQFDLVQLNISKTEKQITTWENRLWDFIYMATRYSISGVHAEVKPGFAFSVYFQDHVTEARTLYEQFKQALRQDVVYGNVNTDFYRKDIEKRFLPKIKRFEDWYNQHKEETEIFGEYNPYTSMWNVIESTREEIYKYFPDLETHDPIILPQKQSNDQRNVFNAMPLDEVGKWFTQLSEKNSKNGSIFLNVEQVDQFVKRAFTGELFTNKLSLNTKAGDKGNVIGLFHSYYIYCITHKPNMGKIDPTASAEKYIRLLTDYFDNWNFDEVKHNFRSGGNWNDRP